MPTPLLDNRQLGPDTARLNLLTNGGFEIWQRGNGPFTGSNILGPDMWTVFPAGTDTLSVARDTTNTDFANGSNVAAQCNFVLGNGAGGTAFYQVARILPDSQGLRNRTVTFSVRVRTAQANAINARVNCDGTGGVAVNSPAHPGDNTWRTLSVTTTVPVNATFVSYVLVFTANCTAYVDNAMAVIGAQAADYTPLHPAEEISRCQRYYEIFEVASGNEIFTGTTYPSSGFISGGWFPFKQTKAVAPTATFQAPQWVVQSLVDGTQASSGPATFVTSSGVMIRVSGSFGSNGQPYRLFPQGGAGFFYFEANT